MTRALAALCCALLVGAAPGPHAHAHARAAARCYESYDGLVWSAATACSAPLGATSQASVFSNLHGGANCRVSFEGLVWYRLTPGDVAPILATQARCDRPGLLTRLSATRVPDWATPGRSTRALLAIASLQEPYAPAGMQLLAQLAHAAGYPVTWMIGDPRWIALNAATYDADHARYRDDVQTQADPGLVAAVHAALPWFQPRVAVAAGAAPPDPARILRLGDDAFWGIAWNSHGVDGRFDRGAPWGSYCADPHAFRRPAPGGACPLVGLEWTARDLTAAYWSGREDVYSTDPDDLIVRGGFAPAIAAAYARRIVDAYAAAGENRRLVVVAQQESAEMLDDPTGDGTILAALYNEAAVRGLRPVTLAQAADAARADAKRPRAVAFPVIAPDADPRWVATIDFHDAAAAMTFAAGRTLPVRLTPYAASGALGAWPLPELGPRDLPVLTAVAAGGGELAFAFSSPVAMHVGIAIWADPDEVGCTSPNVYPAGRAGDVITFDLPAGVSQRVVRCTARTTTFAYAT